MTFDVILNEYYAPERDFDSTNCIEQADPITAPIALTARTEKLETPDNPIVLEGRQ